MQLARMKDKQLLELAKPSGDYDVITYIVTWKSEYYAKNLIQPLEPYFDDSNLSDGGYLISDIIPGYLSNAGYVGGRRGYLGGPGARLVGLPFGAETSIMAYRKDILDGLGLKAPTTYDELLRILPIIKEKGNIGAMTSRGQASAQIVHAWLLHLNPLGGEIFDEKWNPIFQRAAGVKALNVLKTIADTGPVGVPGFAQGDSSNAFLQGNAAIYLDSIAIFGQVNDPKQSKVDGKVAYALHPKGVKSASQTGGLGMAIPRNSKNKEAAFLLMQWITSRPQDKKVAKLGGNANRTSTLNDPELRAQYPEYTLLAEQLQYADPDWRPLIPQWDGMAGQIFGPALNDGMTGKKDAAQALEEIVPKVREIMAQAGYYK